MPESSGALQVPAQSDRTTAARRGFSYAQQRYAADRIDVARAAAKAAGPGQATRCAYELYRLLSARADPSTGIVPPLQLRQLQRAMRVSRTTIWRAARLLVRAGLIAPPRTQHDPRTRRVCGSLFRVIVGSSSHVSNCIHNVRVKSMKSSALRAPLPTDELRNEEQPDEQRALPLVGAVPRPRPARPLDDATPGFIQKAVWDVTNADAAPTVPTAIVDAVRALLRERGATATDAGIRAGIVHVDQQRRRQQSLPLSAPGRARQPRRRVRRAYGRRSAVGRPRHHRPPPGPSDVSKADARALVEQLGTVKTMPGPRDPVEHATRLQQQIADVRRELRDAERRERRRPFTERLDEMFQKDRATGT